MLAIRGSAQGDTTRPGSPKPDTTRRDSSKSDSIPARPATPTPAEISPGLQDIKVSGKVTDASGGPLGGVSITIKGTSRGTATDNNGNYTLMAPADATLVLSYIGYEDKEVPVGDQSVVNVKLTASAGKALQQVIVVGYGTQRKVDVTGSNVTVSGDAVSRQPVVSVDQSLQGKVAGLNIINSGVPGAPSTLQLRGVNSVSGSTAPIYVVDGNITSDISYLDPNEIEKIDVLKDASSLAIFGVNAGNGAIMITTKRGRTGKARLSYTGYIGVQQTNHLIKMANASQYAELTNEQYRAEGNPPPFPDSALGAGTDWYKQVLRTAIIHSNDLIVTGGSESNTYNFGAGFINTQGTVKKTDYSNLRLHLGDEYRFGKVVKIGENINVSRYEQNNPTLSANVVKEAYNYDPTVVPFSKGLYGVSLYTNSGNPLADLNYNDQDKLTGSRLSGNVYAEIAFLKHFTFRSDFDLDYNNSSEKKYTPTFIVSANQQNITSTLENWQYRLTNWYWRNYATYDQTIADIHHITVTAGTEARETNNSTTYLKAKSVPGAGAATEYFNLGDPSSFVITDGAVSNAIFSYYGRVNYTLMNRYLLNANLRSDYSSQYPSNHRNILSPAVGVGWRISEERFMEGLKPIVNNLKLRYSWGRLPNANLPNSYIAFPQIGTLTGQGGTQPVFGGSLNSGVTVLNVPNPTLSWEYTEESNPGIEAGFIHNRLTVEADYYIRKTRNLVINVPIPSQSGSVNTEYENAGTVQNKGFEFMASYSDNRNPFKWTVGLNFATLQNKMLYVQGGDSIAGGSLGNGYLATITRQGLPIGTFYGYRTAGVFQDQGQLGSTPHTSAAQVGDLIYRDINKDGQIDNGDRVNLGSSIPKLTYGITSNFSYAHWDLSIDLQGVYGNKIYNGNRSVRLTGYNFDLDQYTHRWHGPGTSNKYPAALNGSDSYAFPSEFFVESGSYFRIRNLQLGYDLPAGKKWGFTSFRIFASAQDLLTIFKYKGFNPEVTGVAQNSLANGIAQSSNGLITASANGQALNSGVDLSTYPIHATYNLGLTLGF
ncbi:MAG TPA: TonB-dependent receptor [Puia sp.]|nr:TonB-dependent receptor [Puia sp.]